MNIPMITRQCLSNLPTPHRRVHRTARRHGYAATVARTVIYAHVHCQWWSLKRVSAVQHRGVAMVDLIYAKLLSLGSGTSVSSWKSHDFAYGTCVSRWMLTSSHRTVLIMKHRPNFPWNERIAFCNHPVGAHVYAWLNLSLELAV